MHQRFKLYLALVRHQCHSRMFRAGIQIDLEFMDARLNLSPYVLSGEHSGMTCRNPKGLRYILNQRCILE